MENVVTTQIPARYSTANVKIRCIMRQTVFTRSGSALSSIFQKKKQKKAKAILTVGVADAGGRSEGNCDDDARQSHQEVHLWDVHLPFVLL
jgi:hypothetical protein